MPNFVCRLPCAYLNIVSDCRSFRCLAKRSRVSVGYLFSWDQGCWIGKNQFVFHSVCGLFQFRVFNDSVRLRVTNNPWTGTKTVQKNLDRYTGKGNQTTLGQVQKLLGLKWLSSRLNVSYDLSCESQSFVYWEFS